MNISAKNIRSKRKEVNNAHINKITYVNGLDYYFSFHLDHCGALPWFLEKTAFRGRCFMTHATKAIYRWLLSDYVKVRYNLYSYNINSKIIVKTHGLWLGNHILICPSKNVELYICLRKKWNSLYLDLNIWNILETSQSCSWFEIQILDITLEI